MIQELVLQDFVQVGTSLRISRQNSLNQVACGIRNVDMVWEGVAVLADTPVRGFDIGSLEGWLTDDERVNDNTKGPDIDLVGVA